MARYKRIDTSPRFLSVDLARQPLPGTFEHACTTCSAPDGICLHAEGAAWYADVPNQRVVRVREGDEVRDTVPVDRGSFACMLGGPDRRTLFILAAEWRGMAQLEESLAARSGQGLTVRAPAPRAGWP